MPTLRGFMSAGNKAHAHTAYVLFAIGAVLLLVGFANSGWRMLALSLAALNLAVGAVMLAAVSIVEGVPWFVQRLSRSGEPVWAGNLIHTDGGRHKVRYEFDSQNQPWFVARDICNAIGTRAPHENALHCGGIPLLRYHENDCFSEASVQAYLVPLAIRNRAANRLLISIRNDVLRKLDKQRAQSTQGPGRLAAPAVGLESPFEMLLACHERVNRSLELLRRLQVHLRDKGLDEDARQAALDVMRYFDVAAPLHHQDEELHVFPPLLQGSDPSLHEVVNKLMNDHRAMEMHWSAARATLSWIAEFGTQVWTPLTSEQTESLSRFAALYDRHIADEEKIVYPAARSSMEPRAIDVMSEDMKRRRGVQ